jgi:S1-C subfamily serine protease
MDQSKKNTSNSLKVALIAILIIILFGCSIVTYIGWRNRHSLFDFNFLKDKEDTRSSEDKKAQHTFAAEDVYDPKGNIIDLVQKVSPSVVTVITETESKDLLNPGGENLGTGFFVSEDGWLITNQHVVCEANNTASNLSIVTASNKSYKIESVVVDPVQDIAILKVKLDGEKVPYLKFANPKSDLLVGQEVIAIGNPLGVNPGSVTRGIISGLHRNLRAQGACKDRLEVTDYEDVIQTDAAINAGNSGGPLLNTNGEVVGVNSAADFNANDIAYSVPFQRVLKLLERYEKNQKLTFPFIGVEYSMIDINIAKSRNVPAGAFIRNVVPGSPAAKAGLRKGDIIVKINDKELTFSLQSTLNLYFEPNQKVSVQVYRFTTKDILDEQVDLEGKNINLDLTIGEK